jgi:hypothetical protein
LWSRRRLLLFLLNNFEIKSRQCLDYFLVDLARVFDFRDFLVADFFRGEDFLVADFFRGEDRRPALPKFSIAQL